MTRPTSLGQTSPSTAEPGPFLNSAADSPQGLTYPLEKSGRNLRAHDERQRTVPGPGRRGDKYLRSGEEITLQRTVQLSRVPSKTGQFYVQFRELGRVRSTESSGFMERAMGIEPRHDFRYVPENVGCSCELPSKTVHNG